MLQHQRTLITAPHPFWLIIQVATRLVEIWNTCKISVSLNYSHRHIHHTALPGQRNFSRLDWTSQKAARQSSCWRLLTINPCTTTGEEQYFSINSCNFLVLSEGEHRAVCPTSSITNWQESEDTVKSITCNCNCIKHQEYENHNSINDNYKEPLSAGNKWTLIVSKLDLKTTFFFSLEHSQKGNTCLQSECTGQEFTIKLSLLVYTSLTYALTSGKIKPHAQKTELKCIPTIRETKEVWLLSLSNEVMHAHARTRNTSVLHQHVSQ